MTSPFKLPVRKGKRYIHFADCFVVDIWDADNCLVATKIRERQADHLVTVLNNWDRVVGALKFYANESRWSPHEEYDNASCFDAKDGGKTARDILKEISNV